MARLFKNTSSKIVDPAKKFKIGKKLGAGAFASVYMALDRADKKVYALKKISLSSEAPSHHKPQVEYQISKDLLHKNIVRTIDSFHIRDSLYLQLEFGDGGDLFSCLDPNGSGIDMALSKKYICGLAEGLLHLQETGIVHADIKPENCLISKGNLKICDFGLAGYTNEVRTGRATGTGAYMAPELINRSSSTEYKLKCGQDVWAFGIVLYAVLFQDLPWEKAKPSDEDFSKYWTKGAKLLYPFNIVSHNMRTLLSSCICINPKERSSMTEVVSYLKTMGNWFPEGNRKSITSYGIRDLTTSELLSMAPTPVKRTLKKFNSNSSISEDSVLSMDDMDPLASATKMLKSVHINAHAGTLAASLSQAIIN